LTGPIKESLHTIWTNVITAQVDSADIDGQSIVMHFALWKAFPNEHKYTNNKWKGEEPGVDFARPVK
jgi:hypothetical protein